ncbi:hypothetical protein AB0L10_21165 [Streptomyces flaveolus]|uniref:hypothetical protein n=1 Tax=Streptomyces flaveolus TaxID=67297 RepID=UPI003414748B
MVKAFGANDGDGWLTSGAVKTAHEKWGAQVKELMNMLSADKGALRAANRTLTATDAGVGAAARRPSVLDQYAKLTFSALVRGVRRDLTQSQVYLGLLATDGAELVAEWRVRDPAWHAFFARTQLSRTLEIRMRLVPERREVRALDREWEVTWVGGTPRFALSKEQSRGQVRTVSRRWTVDRGSDGRLRMTEDFRFDSAELKTPLQEAVLRLGWVWRGVLFKL